MFDISQLMLPGNLPNLNAIEPAWPLSQTNDHPMWCPYCTSFAKASSQRLTVWESRTITDLGLD